MSTMVIIICFCYYHYYLLFSLQGTTQYHIADRFAACFFTIAFLAFMSVAGLSFSSYCNIEAGIPHLYIAWILY